LNYVETISIMYDFSVLKNHILLLHTDVRMNDCLAYCSVTDAVYADVAQRKNNNTVCYTKAGISTYF